MYLVLLLQTFGHSTALHCSDTYFRNKPSHSDELFSAIFNMALVGSDGQENMIFYNLLHAEDGLSGCLTIILDYCHPSHFTSNPHIVLLILFSTAQVFQCSHFSLFSFSAARCL